MSYPVRESGRIHRQRCGRGSEHGLRVFAGVRWDPFIMDAPAALKTIATRKLAFTDPGSIFLDGKNVLSIVAEIDAGSAAGLDTRRRRRRNADPGALNVRIERVGRPEVKNMMLAPKEFDPVNRDLEIRDLYNMEDAFHLADAYQGAYRARWTRISPSGMVSTAKSTGRPIPMAGTRSRPSCSRTSWSWTSRSLTSRPARSWRLSWPHGAANHTGRVGAGRRTTT